MPKNYQKPVGMRKCFLQKIDKRISYQLEVENKNTGRMSA